MRVVADTNIVVSGLLWSGPPRRILDFARVARINLFTSPDLLLELEDVLSRRKFARRLAVAGVEPRELALGYAALARVTLPRAISPVIEEDPDDDAVLACALTVRADVIVSGDRHLLNLQKHEGIWIVRASEFLVRLES
jgi:putative PIN family toxin of toxin-antitoxin system